MFTTFKDCFTLTNKAFALENITNFTVFKRIWDPGLKLQPGATLTGRRCTCDATLTNA